MSINTMFGLGSCFVGTPSETSCKSLGFFASNAEAVMSVSGILQQPMMSWEIPCGSELLQKCQQINQMIVQPSLLKELNVVGCVHTCWTTTNHWQPDYHLGEGESKLQLVQTTLWEVGISSSAAKSGCEYLDIKTCGLVKELDFSWSCDRHLISYLQLMYTNMCLFQKHPETWAETNTIK